MGRLIAFLLTVGGGAYLVAGWLADRFGASPSPVLRISLSVIAAVLCWTALSFWAAERIGDGTEAGPRSEPPGGTSGS